MTENHKKHFMSPLNRSYLTSVLNSGYRNCFFMKRLHLWSLVSVQSDHAWQSVVNTENISVVFNSITIFNPFRFKVQSCCLSWSQSTGKLREQNTYRNPNGVMQSQLKSHSWRRRRWFQDRWGCYICFPSLSCFIRAQGASKWRACEPANGVAKRWVQGHDGAPGPVKPGVDSLKDCPAKQDVYPGIQDLVPGGEA